MVGIQLSSKVKEANDDELKEIKKKLMEKYDQEAKLLPVNLVLNPLYGQNMFFLSATGFGKYWISRIYFNMLFQDRQKKSQA